MTDLERAAKRWDDTEWAQGIPANYWSHHPLINAYIHATIAPHSEHMLDWFARNFLQDGPVERAISLCCGLGIGDRQALKAGVCRYLEGVDISPASLRFAQTEAERDGLGDRVHYWAADVNTLILEKSRYDVMFSLGALHHVVELEHVCDQLRQALKPDGYLFVNEYVGPARFQWTSRQLDLLNRIVSILPPAWRHVDQVKLPELEKVIAADPSEAVRSDQVMSTLCQYFELVDYADYGGALLRPLWEYALVPQVFMQSRPVDRQVIIKLLILLDELVAEHQLLPSNCVQLVLRNCPPKPGHVVSRRLAIQSPDRGRWVEQWLPGTVLDSPPTPGWRLPGKAANALVQHGPRRMLEDIGAYLQWRISRQ